MGEKRGAAQKPLTPRQKKFAEHYAASGNATEAARLAGYKGSDNQLAVQGAENLRKPKIAAYLEALTAQASVARIATVEELREFWTATLRDGGHEMKDRLKASDMLGKSLGVFIEKREHSGGLKIQVVYGDE